LKTSWDRVAKTQKVELGSTSVPQPVTVTVESKNLVTPPVVECKCVEMNHLLSALRLFLTNA